MAANIMRTCAVFALMVLCLAQAPAWGEVLPDPTRPPSGLGDVASTADQAAYPPVRGLQSVIVSPDHCAAIIDGKTVALGARHGNEKLVEVNQRGVVLQGERGRRALTLFPAVGMKMTEALPQDKSAASCRLDQIKDKQSPAKLAGQRENK